MSPSPPPNSPLDSGESRIMGKNAVLTLLGVAPKRIFKILMEQDAKPDKRLEKIRALAEAAGIPWQRVPWQKLNAMAADADEGASATGQKPAHQGVIAIVAPKPLLEIHGLIATLRPTIEAGGWPRVMLLDGVSDPRNVGAILRVADAAGFAAVIMSKRDCPGFGPVVSKAASGADASVAVAVVPNLTQALDALKQAGFWSVGAVADEPGACLYYRQDYAMPLVLALGAEGAGLSRLVREQCDFRVTIPMTGVVDSLNVSCAAAVLAFDAQARFPAPSS